jgi:hypothetical protein
MAFEVIVLLQLIILCYDDECKNGYHDGQKSETRGCPHRYHGDSKEPALSFVAHVGDSFIARTRMRTAWAAMGDKLSGLSGYGSSCNHAVA